MGIVLAANALWLTRWLMPWLYALTPCIKVYFANVHPRFPDGGKMSQHFESLKVLYTSTTHTVTNLDLLVAALDRDTSAPLTSLINPHGPTTLQTLHPPTSTIHPQRSTLNPQSSRWVIRWKRRALPDTSSTMVAVTSRSARYVCGPQLALTLCSTSNSNSVSNFNPHP